ncbi:ABC transporter substrate-binding protein [Roseomonas stagni]|uniref:ABC transporter substrate-binding protein n=1 Tax=Falsiroseomonas algicola TaxID=2716930 RepID=A0A6M1LKM1_9PROT|nr:ABC transporter substrate-binding protein [Falsiroseomonas algicola]
MGFTTKSRLPLRAAIALLGLGLGFPAAQATDLRIGTTGTPTLDPHFMLIDTNIAYNQHIYGALIDQDARGQLHPDLALSWAPEGDNAWRFRLRPGVTFHDGTPFTADDVVFSLQRVPNIPNNPAPYTGALLGVTEVRKVDDLTVDLVTDGFVPMLPNQIAKLSILSRHAAEGRGTEEFNQGRAAIGTGPYRLVRLQGRDRLQLQRNDSYWGEKPAWNAVEFRVLPNDAARSAGLLAGDVDLIEFVPLHDAARLASTPGITLHSGSSSRVMFLGVNLDPRVAMVEGRSPLTDPRVRQAISLAANREGMIRSLLLGYGQAASQIGIPSMNGYVERQVDRFAPDEARRLLAEAGYPNGFSTALLCTNDRYVADAQVCQALGQMLARIGIRADVQAVPANVYFGRVRAGNNPAPLFLGAWSNNQGDAGYTLNNLFHSLDRGRRLGASNRSGYSDAETDRDIQAALNERDPARRRALLLSANRRATEARVLIPFFTAPVLVASKSSIRYEVGDSGSSEMTSAMRAFPR